MYISTYEETWLSDMDDLAQQTVAAGRNLYLLVDGAFSPGLYRHFQYLDIKLLFRSLPGCDAKADDVSPFLVGYEGGGAVKRALQRCSGWPMISLIDSAEPLELLAERLSRWCIVEADNQFFNLRYADTRRLPAIYSTLTAQQRSNMLGDARSLWFMGRDGKWALLPIKAAAAEAVTTDIPRLDIHQYSRLIEDSITDEILSVLKDRGHAVESAPFRYYRSVVDAVSVAGGDLDWYDLVQWVDDWMSSTGVHQKPPSRDDYLTWRAEWTED